MNKRTTTARPVDHDHIFSFVPMEEKYEWRTQIINSARSLIGEATRSSADPEYVRALIEMVADNCGHEIRDLASDDREGLELLLFGYDENYWDNGDAPEAPVPLVAKELSEASRQVHIAHCCANHV